ncbi:type IV secretory system conjugative DNA transfer family protein [Clostridium sp. SYSU_GA19001]|uniref:type IV secretory system conjugative DNA transfer family protein n=1 Tax=Clostridium caldaquaticum TaxID=2940653 RepID=UPI002077861A|nr:type IV secretory system conjugative DNA transfer family protein [Clostridium caldaquaticum]MCM8710557.1 type IV secretory system conjugative DNA transfer family protein [Clostridium caldaquaticum]
MEPLFYCLLLADKLLKVGLFGCGLWLFFEVRKVKKNKLGTSKLQIERSKLTGDDGFILSKNFQLNFKKSCENVVVIAPPGEGKTRSFFTTNLLNNCFPKSSIVIPDLKGELWKSTADYQKSIGRKIIKFEILGEEGFYNPLSNCDDFAEIRKLAINILENAQVDKDNKNSEWISMSAPLLTAALLKENTIDKALDLIILNDEETLEKEFLKSNPQAQKQFLIFKTSLRSPGTVDSIRSTLATSLALYGDIKLIKTISKNSFSPKDLREEPIALYISYEPSKAKYLSPFLGIFYTQLIEKTMDFYTENSLPVIFMLEELQNLGKIQGLESILALNRIYEMPFLCCLQNISKLYDIYGQNNAMTILNCLKTKCILPSISDLEALKYVSELCGETEVIINHDKGKITKHSKKLFTPDEVRRLSNSNKNSDDTVLIIAHNKLPFVDKQYLI